jgi:hypothetical protein
MDKLTAAQARALAKSVKQEYYWWHTKEEVPDLALQLAEEIEAREAAEAALAEYTKLNQGETK